MKVGRFLFLLILPMLLGLGATPIQAGDDAGVRSVFARGAGGRALGLGGAYVAVADDATAMIWNPAGLGRIDRNSLYATHSNLVGMGFSEQLAVMVIPSWRLGTFSISMRRFGVDGIEGTNDRGIITAENLEDSETELALGYGRALGQAWFVGGSLKFQRQALAGYSDAAGAMDVGVQVKPFLATGIQPALAEKITVGLAVRNIIEPSLQLDQESVPDPTGVRFGAALVQQVGQKAGFLLTADLEKTKDMQTKLHAGCEAKLLDVLALRIGSNAGMLVAGVGLTWQDALLDITYEDNPIEAVTRIGVGWTFGQSALEKKQSVLDLEERRLQEQLASAFAQEKNKQIAGVVQAAEQALAREDYQEGFRLTATLRVIDPEHPAVDSLEAAAYCQLGLTQESSHDLAGAAISFGRCLVLAPGDVRARKGLARVREESNRQAARTAEINSLFEQGMSAFAAGDLVVARDLFLQVLTANPEDAEAEALLEHTRQTLVLRGVSLAERAASLAMVGQLDQARKTLAEGRQLVPDHASIQSAEIAIKEAAVSSTAAAANRQSSAGLKSVPALERTVENVATFNKLSAARRKEVVSLYRNGMDAASMGRRDEALRYWELVWSLAPDYQQISQHLKEEYLVRGLESFASGDLEQAIVLWEKARKVDPDDPRAQGYLARAQQHQTRIQELRRGQ